MMRVVFLAALTFLGAPATAQENDDTTAAAPEQQVSIEPVARDSQIKQRIVEILDATGWYDDTAISVDDGVVFLDGSTDTPERRQWARDLAAKTQDVVAVVNRIGVDEAVTWSFDPAIAELEALAKRSIAALPLILLSLIVLPLAWWIAKGVAALARRLLSSRTDSPFLRDVIARAIALPVFLVGVYLVLQVAGLTQLALSLVGGAGVLGIVIGFAFRDIAENFLASLLLSIRRPFSRGDFIDVAGQTGVVNSMNTRSTVLVSTEGNHIQIPNAVVFKSTIENFTAAPKRRDSFDVGVGYDVSVADAQGVILGALEMHEAVAGDPEPLALVDSLGASTVNLKVYYWFDGHTYSKLKVRSALLRQVKKALTEAGVSMPDEAREIIFPQGVPVLQLSHSAEDRAQSLAKADIAETARAERAAQTEPDTSEHERNLHSEVSDLEAQAAATPIEDGGDLLGDAPKSSSN